MAKKAKAKAKKEKVVPTPAPMTQAEEERGKAATAAAKKAAKGKIETRHLSELSKADREYIEELLRKDPSALTEGELSHLTARAAYLTSDERKKFLG